MLLLLALEKITLIRQGQQERKNGERVRDRSCHGQQERKFQNCVHDPDCNKRKKFSGDATKKMS